MMYGSRLLATSSDVAEDFQSILLFCRDPRNKASYPKHPRVTAPCISAITFNVKCTSQITCKFKLSVSPGSDGIPSAALLNSGPYLPNLLPNPFTHSIKYSFVPCRWKWLVIMRYHKGGLRWTFQTSSQ